jgi:hypothetical protein
MYKTIYPLLVLLMTGCIPSHPNVVYGRDVQGSCYMINLNTDRIKEITIIDCKFIKEDTRS